MQDPYIFTLSCQKCKLDNTGNKSARDPSLSDGMWFLQGRGEDNHGLYCCTGCIVWFRERAHDYYPYATQWSRMTRREYRKYPFPKWRESTIRTKAFALHHQNVEKRQERQRLQEAQKAKAKRKRVKNVTAAQSASCAPPERQKNKKVKANKARGHGKKASAAVRQTRRPTLPPARQQLSPAEAASCTRTPLFAARVRVESGTQETTSAVPCLKSFLEAFTLSIINMRTCLDFGNEPDVTVANAVRHTTWTGMNRQLDVQADLVKRLTKYQQ